jgi:8-oxo-dGTP diphosphatase
MSFTYKFPMVSATATVILYDEGSDMILLGLRGKNNEAYPDHWCIPGGFLNAKVNESANTLEKAHPGETLEQCAVREVFEETGIKITEDQLELFWVCSDPGADPRVHVVNACYWVNLSEEQADAAEAGDDLTELAWFSPDEIEDYDIAFNHNDIIERGVDANLEDEDEVEFESSGFWTTLNENWFWVFMIVLVISDAVVKLVGK